jgi:hypothetical protein
MLTRNSKYSEFLARCRSFGECGKAETLSVDANIEAIDNRTLEEVVSAFSKMKKNTTDEGGIIWAITTFGQEIEKELRYMYISNISEPMLAVRLYLDCPFLTDEEDALLESKFKGKLPNAEDELATGKVKRVKK